LAATDTLDWLTPLAERGPVPGLRRPLTIELSVPKTADGDLTFTATFAPAAGQGEGDADRVELTAVPAVAEALASGELSPNVAWMSGRLKASGPTGPLLAVLALAEAA
jgi:hypothetical protein